jgi:AbrB family looped-hinge helix DNA binding protein
VLGTTCVREYDLRGEYNWKDEYAMTSRVGSKGQVVIAKEIRDALGIVPGSLAVQRQVGDTVELRFLPPEHHRSLRGILAQYVTVAVSAEAARVAEDAAWADDAARRDRKALDGGE